MKRFKSKALSLALIAVLSVSMLAGCGKKDGEAGGNGSGSGKGGKGGTVAADSSASKEGVWKGTTVDLGFDGDVSVGVTAVKGDTVFMLAQNYNYTDNGYTTEYFLVTMNKDGSNVSKAALEGTKMEQIYDYKEDPVEGEEGDGEVIDDGDGEVNILEDAEPTEAPVGAAPSVSDIFPVSEIAQDEEEGDVSYRSVNNLGITSDGEIIGVVYEERMIDPITYNYSSTNTITAWNPDGSIKWQVPFTNESDGYTYIMTGAVLSNGNYFVAFQKDDGNTGLVYDADGNEILNKKLEFSGWDSVSSILVNPEGKDLLVYYTYDDVNYTEQYKTAVLDPETLEVTDEQPVVAPLGTNGLYQVVSGAGYDMVYLTNVGIFGFDRTDAETSKVMDFINSDLDASYMNRVSFIDDQTFVGVYSSMTDYTTVVGIFTYVDPSTIPDKTTLILACNNLDWDIRTAVLNFNKENSNYRITIRDYSDYSTYEDWTGSYTQLNNDIMSGKTPDILYVGDMGEIDPGVYANKGLLADVEELIKNDAELSSNTYLSNIMDLYRYDGKSVVVIPSFQYMTVAGLESEFASHKGWGAEEFMNYAKSLDPDQSMFEDFTRSQFMNYVMQFCGSDFVNVTSGKCDFNNDTFINLLKFAATLPEEIQYDEDYWNDYETFYSSGRIKLDDFTLNNLQSYNNYVWYNFKAPTVNVGFPTVSGNGGVIRVYNGLMLFAKSANLDGAWQFCRQYLANDYQENLSYGIPVLQSAFDKWAQQGMERYYWENENGEKEYYDSTYEVDGQTYTIPVMTQEQVDSIKQDITSCATLAYSNEAILGIIEEEASALYSGAKTAEDVAAVIQSRVQIYVSENQN